MSVITPVTASLRDTCRRAVRPPWLYLTVFGLSGCLALIGTLLPFALARHVAHDRSHDLQIALQQVNTLNSTLVTTGDPSRLAPGQPTPVKRFTTSLSETNTNFTPTQLSTISLTIPNLIPWFYPGQLISAVNRTQKSTHDLPRLTNTALSDTKHALTHHALVMAALTQILAYNPTLDFAQFDPNSQDTKKRLELAEKGLDRTKKNLQNLTQNDPTLSQVITQIDQLQRARTKLATDHDVADWIAATQTAQSAILTNRTTYWSATTAPLLARLDILADDLARASQSWQPLAAGQLQ